MINLEGIAHKLTAAVYGNSDLSDVDKAKIEYGLSLILGVGITLGISLLLAVLLGTVFQVFMLTVSALILRMFSGGGHCSSYDRCLIFSLLVFVPTSVLVKHLASTLPAEILITVYFGLVFLIMIYMLVYDLKLTVLVILVNGLAAVICYLFNKNVLLGTIFAVGTGMFIQTVMITKPGQLFVEYVDKLLNLVEKWGKSTFSNFK